MNKLIAISSIILGMFSQLTLASGQRTENITTESIKEYRILNLKEGELNENVLHYIGTVNNQYHILMITKTSYSERSDGSVGMPWDQVFKYKIPVEKMTVINGWDIAAQVKNGINIRPSSCPRLFLSSKKKEYDIINIKRVKLNGKRKELYAKRLKLNCISR